VVADDLDHRLDRVGRGEGVKLQFASLGYRPGSMELFSLPGLIERS